MWSEVSCCFWGASDEIGGLVFRTCVWIFSCVPGSVGIQSGSSRGKRGISAGGSLLRGARFGRKGWFRPLGAWRCVGEGCATAGEIWRRAVFPLQLCWQGMAWLRSSMSYDCACKIFGVAFSRHPEFRCCWAPKSLLLVGRQKQHVRGWGGGECVWSGCGQLQARRSFFPSSRGGCASVVFASDPLAPPMFQCCVQAATANLLRHVSNTTLTFGVRGWGCSLACSIQFQRFLQIEESRCLLKATHTRTWIWGRF